METANKVNESDVHYLPCESSYDGPAEVKSYFKVTTSTSSDSSTLKSALRGHELFGEVLPVSCKLPVRGLCVNKCEDGDDVKLRVVGEFSQMTVWQHDAKPDIAHMQDCINWFDVASAVHR